MDISFFPSLASEDWQSPVESFSDLPTPATDGEVRLVLDTFNIYAYDADAGIWVSLGSGGGGASFTTIQTDNGTSPVATGPNDTLTLTSSDGSVIITGDASVDEVDFRVDINGLTEDTTPDKATDFVMTYDASAAGLKKVKLEKLGANSLNGLFGSGVDGDVVISSNTSLTEDMYYNNLTVNATYELDTNGFKIFVKNTTTPDGVIAHNGKNANPVTNGGGAGRSSGTIGVSYAGGSGGISGAGQNGTNAVNSLGGIGGAGGTGASGAGGAGGTVTNPISGNGGPKVWNSPFQASTGRVLNATQANFGAGGGGGGSDGTTGAGAGGGGGCVILFSKKLAGNGSIEAKGGNGKNASGGNKGGGGGGGGGVVVIFSQTNITDTSLTVSVAGGTAGTGTGTGTDGTAGGAGTFIDLTGAD